MVVDDKDADHDVRGARVDGCAESELDHGSEACGQAKAEKARHGGLLASHRLAGVLADLS
jgi:hypothetical protein